MAKINCKWLPELIPFSNFEDWKCYEDFLYNIFINDFIISKPLFILKPVNIRKHPMILDKEQAFFHITNADEEKNSADPNDRLPDLNRCERIKWPRKVIENYTCNDICQCNKLKLWWEPYKSYKRAHLLFEDVNYIVIIEERETFNLLVTAFYIKYDHELRKKIKRFERYSRT